MVEPRQRPRSGSELRGAEYRDATVFTAWPAADYGPDQASLTPRLRQIVRAENPAFCARPPRRSRTGCCRNATWPDFRPPAALTTPPGDLGLTRGIPRASPVSGFIH